MEEIKQKTKEDIAYNAWRKLVEQNWSNVAGEIEVAMEEYSNKQIELFKEKLKEEYRKYSFAEYRFDHEEIFELIDTIKL